MPQDYSGKNLRGRSFKGQKLEGANFSNANLEGTNFSNANLEGTNFSNANLEGANFHGAKAGLQLRWKIGLIIISWLLSAISALFAGNVGYSSVLVFYQRGNLGKLQFAIATFIALVILLVVNIHQKDKNVGVIFGSVVFAFALSTAFVGAFTITGSVAAAVIFAFISAVVGTFTRLKFKVVAILIAVVTTIYAATSPNLNAKDFAQGKVPEQVKKEAVSIVELSKTSPGIDPYDAKIAEDFVQGKVPDEIKKQAQFSLKITPLTTIFACITAVGTILLSNRIIDLNLKEDSKNVWINSFSIAVASIGGTSFRYSNLTNADFTEATLIATDFRDAILTHTIFHKAKMLDYVRPGKSYLQNTEVRKLLVTRQGQDKNFNYQNLRGINLSEAKLVDASFIGADLSETNLKDANLSRAKLVETQLNGTDFTGATLTGAYIQDWGITTNTKFDGVRCEYVYMRLPTKENPDPLRKPDNQKEVFADGEFGDFIQPIFDTLDLYHNQGVDPRAIAISFKQLAENHPEADLRIVGMEVRGEDKFLLRAKTAAMADKSELSAEYFEIYNQLKALAQQELQALISEKDSRIRSLETMVVTALQSPKFYAQTYSNQGDTMSQSPKKQSNFDLKGAQFAGGLVNADTVNAHQIGGNITNYSTEQRQNLAEAATEIQQLLNQLSQSYPTTTTSEKMSIVAKAVDEIESNPTLKARVIGALKAGGTEAFKELIDHPLVNILLASIEGWQEVE